MKKNLLFAALLAAVGALPSAAETVAPYSEGFEGPNARPKGWGNVAASSYAAGTYSVLAEGGHTGGCISANQYSNYYSSYYKNYSYIDVLVTPQITGEMSIYVKSNGTDPSLTFYTLTDPAAITTSAQFLAGTEQNMVSGQDISDWTKITVSDIPAGSYVGIRAHNLLLDDFSATSADVIYAKSAVIAVKNNSGTTLEADKDNNVTFDFDVTVTNTGDVDIPASADGIEVLLFNATNDKKEFGKDKITDAIPYGASVTKNFKMTGPAELAPNTTSNNFQIQFSHADLGSITASLGYFQLIPYKAELKLMLAEGNKANASNYTDVNIQDAVVITEDGRSLWVWNKGTAPLVVNATVVSGDFTVDASGFTLNKDEIKEIKLGVKGAAGSKEGTLTFNAYGLGDVVYKLQGRVMEDGKYFEDFEDGFGAGMINPKKDWAVKDAGALATLGGTKLAAQASTSYPSKLILPMLKFEDGETFSFMAAKSDNTAGNLKVYTSPDRATWTQVYEIKASDSTGEFPVFGNDKPTGTGYGTYDFLLYSIPMEAGETYIAFEAGGARIDNIYGGTPVEVAHDIYVSEFAAPSEGSVNTRFVTSIKLETLTATPETNYAIALEVNGEEVARTAEVEPLEAGTPQTFDLRYMPHDQGEITGKFVFLGGENLADRLELGEFTAAIGAEKMESVYQVGVEKINTTDPLNTSYNGSQCQILYNKDMLAMDKGMKLTGFYFVGYNNTEFTSHVKVWAENTSDVAFERGNIVARDAKDMTLLYDGDMTFEVCGSYAKDEYVPVFTVNFTAPFAYEGESVRLMIEIIGDHEGEQGEKVFVRVDNSAYDYWNDKYDNRVIENKKEYAEDLEDEASWSIYNAGYPVTFFSVSKDVVTVSGIVSEDFSQPVKDAKVTFTANEDDVLYKATTDEAGRYSFIVGNVNYTYTLAAEAEGFESVSHEQVALDAAEPEKTMHMTVTWSDRTATLSGTVMNTTLAEALDAATVTLSDGTDSYTATTDEAGRYEISVPEFKKDFTLTVTKEGGLGSATLFDEPFEFASKADEKDIDVQYTSGVEGVSADAAAKVAVRGACVVVNAPAGMALTLVDARGITMGSAVSDGSELSFGPLAPGLYIVAGTKVVVK